MKNKILIISTLLLLPLFGFSQLVVKEGEKAIYVFLGEKVLPVNEEVNLQRAIGKDYKPLAKVKSAQNVTELRSKLGNDLMNELKQFLKLNNDQEVYSYIQKNPELKKYGLYAFHLDFLEALGMVYADTEAKNQPKNTLVKYKAEFSSNKKDGEIVTGIPPKINKPLYHEVSESDSLITAKWKLKPQGSEDVFLGEVWVSEKANAPFVKAGTTLYSEEDNEIVFTWHQNTQAQLAYRFFLIPQTFLGLSGPKSDTIYAISSNYNNLSFVNNSIAKDTLGGVFLSWDPLKDHQLLSGIIVERSRDTTGNYIVLDTIPAHALSYLDTRILPNTYYKYRFKTLDIRGTVSGGAAYVSGIYKPKRVPLEAPENVKLSYDKTGYPRISWTPVSSAEISGYQIYRSSDLDREFSLVSNLIQDSVYIDTTVHTSRITYKYAIKTLNYENKTSEFSKEVFGRNQTPTLPKTPYDVETYAEPGKLTIRWKDMTSFDEFIQGYNIYRKLASDNDKNIETELSSQDLKARGFIKLNPGPIAEVLLIDKDVKSGNFYQYAVTAVDAFDVEGHSLGAALVNIPTFSLKSPEIYARNTSKGIEITWNDVSVPEVNRYTLYKRVGSPTNAVQIAELKKGIEHFTDTDVKPGELYFYTMKITGGAGVTSPPSSEKSVRKQ